MKTSSIILIGIGVLLLFMQYAAYSGNDFQFPSIYKGHNLKSTIIGSAGNILGFNFFGLLGLVLIIVGVGRKSNS